MKTKRTVRHAHRLYALALLMLLPLQGLAVDRGRQVVVTKPDDAARLMDAVENAVWAADGKPASKAIYVVYSTECAWSKRLFDETRALVGNAQLRWIPVAGNTAASVVAGRDSASVGNAFDGRAARAADAAAQRGVVYNQGVMDSITYQLRPYDRSKTFAFPTLVYRSGKSVKVVAGNPRNLATLATEVASEPRAASLVPAGIALSAQAPTLLRSRNLSKWAHLNDTPMIFRAAPSPLAPAIDDLAKDFLVPVSGIVGSTGWIEVAPWGLDKRKAYVHDPLMARMALLDYRVKPQGGQWQAQAMVQVREFPDADAHVLETLKPGERYRRSGVVEHGGHVWDQIVLYADGAVGYVKR
ncbi:hypothetical protein ASD72_04555 [Pseudoxanthomonas sp. Root630]|nr:hypothetical protein ASD72_04555 [Pseudoxanthomonas sp. Root630]